jgi:preprotein translocase subunit SecE
MADKVKFVLALLLLVAGIVEFYQLAGQAAIWRVLSVLAGVLACAAVGWTTEPGRQFAGFARDSITEAKKVVWPTRKETVQTTGIVFAFVVVMAIFLFATDKTLEWLLYSVILGWKQ